MSKRERIKWIIIASLAVLALIMAFVIPIIAQANPIPSPINQNENTGVANPYPDPVVCDPYPGPYPGPYPYPGTCVYLPTVFSSFSQIWNAIVSGE